MTRGATAPLQDETDSYVGQKLGPETAVWWEMPGWGEKPKSFRINVLFFPSRSSQDNPTALRGPPSAAGKPSSRTPAHLQQSSRVRASRPTRPARRARTHTDRPLPTASEPAQGDAGDTCPRPMRVRAPVECVRTWVACGVHQVPRHSGWGRIPGRTNLILRFPPRSHSLLGVPVVFTLQRCPSPLSLHLWWATL